MTALGEVPPGELPLGETTCSDDIDPKRDANLQAVCRWLTAPAQNFRTVYLLAVHDCPKGHDPHVVVNLLSAVHGSDLSLIVETLGLTAKKLTEEIRVCCQCGAEGAVNSTATVASASQPPVPISWRCAVCRRYVCINCVLTIPGSVPREIYDDTLCSEACKQTLQAQKGVSLDDC